MGEFTQKEWCCLNEYVEDLLGEMRRNGDLTICDQYTEYTMQELVELQHKLLKNIKRLSDL